MIVLLVCSEFSLIDPCFLLRSVKTAIFSGDDHFVLICTYLYFTRCTSCTFILLYVTRLMFSARATLSRLKQIRFVSIRQDFISMYDRVI